jgi:hypothetical protein
MDLNMGMDIDMNADTGTDSLNEDDNDLMP